MDRDEMAASAGSVIGVNPGYLPLSWNEKAPQLTKVLYRGHEQIARQSFWKFTCSAQLGRPSDSRLNFVFDLIPYAANF